MMNDLHSAGWFFSLGIGFMIIALGVVAVVIRSGYKKIDKVDRRVNTFERTLENTQREAKESRNEMNAMSRAYEIAARTNHSLLVNISDRLKSIEEKK